MTNPTFQMGADARLLKQALETLKPGESVTDKALGDAIGKPLDEAQGALRTALHRLLRDDDKVFGRLRKEGWQRLDDHSIVASGVADAERLRRHANRSVERQLKANFDNLTAAEKSQFTAQVSVMASVGMMTKAKSIAKVAAAAPKDTKELPVAATLRLFAAPAPDAERQVA